MNMLLSASANAVNFINNHRRLTNHTLHLVCPGKEAKEEAIAPRVIISQGDCVLGRHPIATLSVQCQHIRGTAKCHIAP